MPSINLAPGTQYIVEMRKRRRNLLLLSIVVVVLVGGVWGSLAWYHGSLIAKENEVDASIRTVNMEIAQLEEEAQRIVLFENRLVALDALLDRHITLDPLLGDLERLLPAPVILKRVAVNAITGGVQISGNVENIDQVAEALASLVEDPGHPTVFSKGSLRGINRVQQDTEEGAPALIRYDFDAELSFNPSLLRKGE